MADPISSSQELSFIQPAKSLNSRKLDVTLISQFSVNRLDVFSKVIDGWQGPISVAM
jgi:hypothetical protein